MSKFKGIFDQDDEQGIEEQDENPTTPAAILPPATDAPASVVMAPQQRGGRTGGKRSDPDYVQVSAYVRRDTYREVRVGLLLEGQDREFSELVDELLRGWVLSRG